jgi:hypothetical protein
MFPAKKHKLIPAGDYVTAEEAVLDKETDIERRCETVDEVIKQNVMPVSKALGAYHISYKQYLGYLMLKNKGKILVDGVTIISILQDVLQTMDLSKVDMEKAAKTFLVNFRKLASEQKSTA